MERDCKNPRENFRLRMKEIKKMNESSKAAKRGKALAEMRLVGIEKDGSRWEVKGITLRSYQQQSRYVNSDKQTSACTCLDYEYAESREFMCEHKYAVWYALRDEK